MKKYLLLGVLFSLLLIGCYSNVRNNDSIYKQESEVKPKPTLVIDCELPKTFKSTYGEVTIEKIRYEYEDSYKLFATYWSGTCGIPYYTHKNVAFNSAVGYKLYDPDGYVVTTGKFCVNGLIYGDKFKDSKKNMFDIEGSGTYRLELVEVEY